MTLLLSHSRKLFPLIRVVGSCEDCSSLVPFVYTELTPSQYCDFQVRPISYALLFHCQSDIVHKVGVSVIESQLLNIGSGACRGLL